MSEIDDILSVGGGSIDRPGSGAPQEHYEAPTQWTFPFFAVIFLIFLSFMLWHSWSEYSGNSEPSTFTYEEWIEQAPDKKWINITGANAELISTVYMTTEGESSPDEIFVPLISADSNSVDEKVRIILRMTSGPIFNQVVEMIGMDETELLMDFASNSEKYYLEGPFSGYETSQDDFVDELEANEPNLADNYIVIDHNDGYPFFLLYLFAGLWVVTLIYVVYRLKGN